MAGTGIVDAFLVYQFVRRLSTPFIKWEAFDTGVIDSTGKIIVPPKDRTHDQRKSFKIYVVMILNLKRLLAKVPGGGSKLATFGAALFLVSEEYETLTYTENQPDEFLGVLKEYINQIDASGILNEEAPTNNAGAGNVRGIAPGEDPPVKKFAGSRVFNVDFYKMWKSRFGKSPHHRYSWYVGNDDIGEEIQEYAKKYPNESIILQDGDFGGMVYLRKK